MISWYSCHSVHKTSDLSNNEQVTAVNINIDDQRDNIPKDKDIQQDLGNFNTPALLTLLSMHLMSLSMIIS